MIEIRLFATLREGRGKILHKKLKPGMTGKALIEEMGISEDQVSIFLINGYHSQLKKPLLEGDVIAIFPPVGGG